MLIFKVSNNRGAGGRELPGVTSMFSSPWTFGACWRIELFVSKDNSSLYLVYCLTTRWQPLPCYKHFMLKLSRLPAVIWQYFYFLCPSMTWDIIPLCPLSIHITTTPNYITFSSLNSRGLNTPGC